MKAHLTKQWKHHRLPAKKDSEFYCRFCSARITDSENMGELGHVGGCPKRPKHFAGMGNIYKEDNAQCPTCGHTFSSQDRMMSHHTLVHGESLLKPRKCEECQTEFRPEESRIRFCSQSCWGEHKKLEPKDCEHCGESFKPDRSSRKYCSVKCSHKGARDRKTCTCEYCDAEFEVTQSRDRKYCSTDCMYDDRRQ